MPTYTLITVTHGGEVRHSRGFESLRMCQEARSIALTGMTIAQAEEADRVAREQRAAWERQRQEAMEAEWRTRHPPRQTTESEAQGLRVMQLVWLHDGTSGGREYLDDWYGGQAIVLTSRSVLGADGLIRDEYKIVGGRSSGMQLLSPSLKLDRDSIRVAQCVIELPDEPAVPLSKLTTGEAA